jgi:chromosome segregation ATPase
MQDAAHRKQEAAVAQLQGHLQQCHSQRQQLQEWHQRAQQELQHLSQQAAEAAAAAASRLADMAASAAPAAVAVEYDQQAAAAQLAAAQDKVLAAEQAANIQRQHVADLQGQLKVLEQQYKKHTKLVPSMDGHKHVAAAGDIVCNTCGQPIDLELHTRWGYKTLF